MQGIRWLAMEVKITMTIPSAEEQLKFITNIQRILDEGAFVSTYKFALIMAIADYSVEHGNDSGESVTLTSRDIAERFIQYYWKQAAKPHPSAEILKQSTDRQPVILKRIIELRTKCDGSLSADRNDTKKWGALLNKAASTIAAMPLWKLQIVGRSIVPFLYVQHGKGDVIEIHPGVVCNFRRFYDLIRNLVQSAWVRHIRTLNEDLSGGFDLSEFLFGTERTALVKVPDNIYRYSVR